MKGILLISQYAVLAGPGWLLCYNPCDVLMKFNYFTRESIRWLSVWKLGSSRNKYSKKAVFMKWLIIKIK